MNDKSTTVSPYYDMANIKRGTESGQHRDVVGGMWEEIGRLQFDLMRDQGLLPHHRLLDIGCGSLRGGVHFVQFLDAENYFGIDINQSLLDVGYDQELDDANKKKLPRNNLKCSSNFDFDVFNKKFNYAIALSVFTHLPLNHIRICLERLAEVMPTGGRFLASFFEIPADLCRWNDYTHHPGNITTHGQSDPYHYRLSDFIELTSSLPWTIHYIGDVNHPRSQRMIVFVKNEDNRMYASQPKTEIRNLGIEEVASLPAGADHYRAYVGPPDRFDFMSATQFALLFQLGMREDHTVLDFGCGSLRLGRLLMPFLLPDHYFGIDPNKWLIEDGIKYENGIDILRIKRPNFSYNDDFNCDVFDENFDFIIAQSIITHTGTDLTSKIFSSASMALKDNGILLFSYIRSGEGSVELPEAGWHYPGCVGYSDTQLLKLLDAATLVGKPIPWYHPGATWFVAGKTKDALPTDDELQYLAGAVLRSDQFKDSISQI